MERIHPLREGCLSDHGCWTAHFCSSSLFASQCWECKANHMIQHNIHMPEARGQHGFEGLGPTAVFPPAKPGAQGSGSGILQHQLFAMVAARWPWVGSQPPQRYHFCGGQWPNQEAE
ncbi:unnamed protein product [Caretta caretta]